MILRRSKNNLASCSRKDLHLEYSTLCQIKILTDKSNSLLIPLRLALRPLPYCNQYIKLMPQTLSKISYPIANVNQCRPKTSYIFPPNFPPWNTMVMFSDSRADLIHVASFVQKTFRMTLWKVDNWLVIYQKFKYLSSIKYRVKENLFLVSCLSNFQGVATT